MKNQKETYLKVTGDNRASERFVEWRNYNKKI